jgi:ESCRT-II complex subunit VPS25
MATSFEFPEYYNFPPFFTLQTVQATKQKQLALWRDLILKYYTTNKIKTLIVHDCPLWANASIDRSLNADAIHAILDDFVATGHGEWEDGTNTRLRVLWRKPDQLASDIYDWAVKKGMVGTVCTLYELHSGEDVDGASFEGADEELLRRAIAILEENGKCALFKGDTSDEDGVKFF